MMKYASIVPRIAGSVWWVNGLARASSPGQARIAACQQANDATAVPASSTAPTASCPSRSRKILVSDETTRNPTTHANA